MARLCLLVASLLLQVFHSDAQIFNDVVHLTCSGEDVISSTLAISEKIHPLLGAMAVTLTCKGDDADEVYYRGPYPLPLEEEIYYPGQIDNDAGCVFEQNPGGYYIEVDFHGFGEVTSYFTSTVGCPGDGSATDPITPPLAEFTMDNEIDLRSYIWTRCGDTSNYIEFIPQTYKAVFIAECEEASFVYTIETDTANETDFYLTGTETDVCVFKTNDDSSRTVDISVYDYSDMSYQGHATLTYCEPRTDKKILKVIPECGSSVSQTPATIRGLADVDADFRAICKNGLIKAFDDEDGDGVNYSLDAYYPDDNDADYVDASTECVFDRRQFSNVFVVTVQVSWGEKGALVHKHTREYQVTCTFDPKGSDETADQQVEDMLIAPKVLQTYDSSEAQSFVALHLMDVLDRQVYALPLGRMVRLRAWSNGRGSEAGIRPVGCDAIGVSSGQRFAIVRAGCGDGIVFEKDEGFTSNGLNTTSPYFKAFEMHGDSQIRFECNFTMCASNCDGDSCEDEPIVEVGDRRRRRSFTPQSVMFSRFVISQSRNL